MKHRPHLPQLPSRLSVLAAVAGVGLGGCSATYDKNFFDYDREQARTRRIFAAQYAAAAKEEASLRPSHFHEAENGSGPRLNALGRERLDYLAMARRPGESITVSVDVPSDRAADADGMVAAARRYLAIYKLPENAILVEAGPATQALSPAATAVAEHRALRGDAAETETQPEAGFGGGESMFGARVE